MSKWVRPIYSTKNQMNGKDDCLFDKWLVFWPINKNKLSLFTPKNYQILPSVFHYYLCKTQRRPITKLLIIIKLGYFLWRSENFLPYSSCWIYWLTGYTRRLFYSYSTTSWTKWTCHTYSTSCQVNEFIRINISF